MTGEESRSDHFFPARIHFLNERAEVLDRLLPADFHRRSQLAVLNGELAADYPVLADLLEGRQLRVHAPDRFAQLLLNFW